MQEPISKKRKLDPNGHVPLVKQESFSEVLQQLEAEEDASGGMSNDQVHSELMTCVDHIETGKAWPRPEVPRLQPSKNAIGQCASYRDADSCSRLSAFQQIEIEESVDPKHGPTLRLFGVSQGGNSVLAHVHGFRPYFYIAAPSGFLNKDLDSLKDTINVSLD
jgi:DNA polymerase delta subunit 1